MTYESLKASKMINMAYYISMCMVNNVTCERKYALIRLSMGDITSWIQILQ